MTGKHTRKQRLESQQRHSTAMQTHKERQHKRSAIRVPLGTTGHSGRATASRQQKHKWRRDNNRRARMLPNRIQEEKTPQLTNNYIARMGPLEHSFKDCKGTLIWIPVQSEKGMQSEKGNSMPVKWSRYDCFNHVADRVASWQTNFDIDCKFKFMQFQADGIMQALITWQIWELSMRDGSTPNENWRLVTYLQ